MATGEPSHRRRRQGPVTRRVLGVVTAVLLVIVVATGGWAYRSGYLYPPWRQPLAASVTVDAVVDVVAFVAYGVTTVRNMGANQGAIRWMASPTSVTCVTASPPASCSARASSPRARSWRGDPRPTRS